MNKEQLIAAGFTEEQANNILALHEESTAGLKSKKDELLDKLAKTKEVKSASESELERLRQLEQKVKLDEAEAKKNYEEALGMVKETSQKEVVELKHQLESVNGNMRKLLVDNGLVSELDKANVNPNLKDAARALLSSKLTVKDGQAVTEDGLTISDLVKSWSETNEGKAFVLANKNSGGGGQGSESGQGGNAAGKKFSELTGDERTSLYRKDPSLYRQLRDAEKK